MYPVVLLYLKCGEIERGDDRGGVDQEVPHGVTKERITLLRSPFNSYTAVKGVCELCEESKGTGD